jgi:hypothetical protein
LPNINVLHVRQSGPWGQQRRNAGRFAPNWFLDADPRIKARFVEPMLLRVLRGCQKAEILDHGRYEFEESEL